jgi:hypothetical protein
VVHFRKTIRRLCPEEVLREQIFTEMSKLSLRIGSPLPFKERIAAAFSLWMATFRPLYLKEKPHERVKGIGMLDAVVNFYIAQTFLEQYGTVELGKGKEKEARLVKIYYDFTCRDLNLSSLEMLYWSIFEPAKVLPLGGDGRSHAEKN